MSRAWLSQLKDAGFEGFSLKEILLSEDKLKALEHRGLIRVFEGFVVEEGCLRDRASRLFDELPGDRDFSLADIKGVQELSRSRLLILLETLEEEGRVLREGDVRRIIAVRALVLLPALLFLAACSGSPAEDPEYRLASCLHQGI